MKVIIKQREEEYKSDYPDGWKFSAGDPFKFPVFVGNNSCFIKRFEQKSPEDISGWDLLVKMSGKFERTLSRIYDIRSEKEDDKEIYYVFYEHLDGVTLDKHLREKDINLMHLNNDLFEAIRALQNYKFWFADFTEKNIFCQKNGDFVLVDVDSTQRITDMPVNDMYGSKDYWILVLKFYKEILNQEDIRLADINGISLNYLQIPFLVLRLKLISKGNRDDYNATGHFSQLPSQLDKMAPEFRDIYSDIIKNGKDPLSPEEINKIQDLVERKIIRADVIQDIVVDPTSLPAVKEFRTNSNEIVSGGTFTLSWQVENASKLELHKNGAKFKELDISEKKVVLKEFADGTRQESSYQLYAYKELNIAKSDPITVRLKDADPSPVPVPDPLPVPRPVPKKFAYKKLLAGAGLLVLAIVAIYLFRKKPDGVLGANAGPDQTIQLPKNTLSLDGGETGSAGKTAFNWTEISGPSATITDPNSASTTVTGLEKGTYKFQLKVTGDQAATALDTVNVTVYEGNNIPPVAKAGVNASAITLPRSDVTLMGTGTDGDGTVAGYAWAKISGPDNATIASDNTASSLVTNLIAGTYVFRLTVTDNLGAVSTDDVTVTVNPAANIPPTANAGKAQTIGVANSQDRATAQLVGSGSDADANGRAINYEWTQTSGVPASITSPNTASTSVTGLAIGTYEFTLKVTDADNVPASDKVQITVQLEVIFHNPNLNNKKVSDPNRKLIKVP